MNGIRDKLMRFMYGRYGMDQLSRFTSILCMVLLILTLFTHSAVLDILAMFFLVYTYFRCLSRNISSRSRENQRYLDIYYRVKSKFNCYKNRVKDSKTHKIFKCPGCGQKIRVPKHKGKISIKCPKCRIEFIRRT